MRSCQFFTICTLLSFFSIASAQTLTPADVHVKLSLAENKTVYRMGEPIKLVMEFTADRDGYTVEWLPDRKERGSDTIVVSPETGVTHWLDELNDNRGYLRDVIATDKLTSSPKRVEFYLNDTLRFDTPGSYTVNVITGRVWKSIASDQTLRLTTNSVTFDVQSMSEEDEAKELKRLTDVLDAGRNPRSDDEVAMKLSYLTGDVSTREKVRRFLSPDEKNGNYNAQIWYGLFIARNRSLALKLIESSMRDPNVPATAQILGLATRLKTLLVHGVRAKPDGSVGALLEAEDPRAAEIREAYVVELAAGLAKRSGNSQTTTAITILSSLPRDTPASNAGLREVRRILVQQFDALHPFNQEWLLRQYWDQLRDPALVPAFKKMLASNDPRSSQIRAAALKGLLDLSPDEARPYVVAEIRNPMSFVDAAVLSAVKDESLPEVDAPLLEQIRTFAALAQPLVNVQLKFKTTLLVRFATASIYRQLMELYQSKGAQLPADARAGLLAYFAKHNEREAIPLIEQAVSELKPGEYPSILSNLAALYYSEAIGELLKKLLDGDNVSLVSHSAYLIGKHGSANDQPVLEERLKRWREQWGNRVAEADAQEQGQVERELILALIGGKSWKLPPARVRELQMSCLTHLCKQSNLVPQ